MCLLSSLFLTSQLFETKDQRAATRESDTHTHTHTHTHAHTRARHMTLSLHDPFTVDTHQVKLNSATELCEASAVTGENEAFARRHSDVHPREFRRRP